MKQQILIIGAGFGGMWSALSATRLVDLHGRNDVQISVLAPQAELRVRPRFYEPNAHQLAAPLHELFEAVGVHFIKGAAETIDVASKTVGYTDASGSKHEFPLRQTRSGQRQWSGTVGHSGCRAEYAFDVDQIEAAIRLETHLKSLKDQPDSRHATPWS
jgi:NADH dehydrogenase